MILYTDQAGYDRHSAELVFWAAIDDSIGDIKLDVDSRLVQEEEKGIYKVPANIDVDFMDYTPEVPNFEITKEQVMEVAKRYDIQVSDATEDKPGGFYVNGKPVEIIDILDFDKIGDDTDEE